MKTLAEKYAELCSGQEHAYPVPWKKYKDDTCVQRNSFELVDGGDKYINVMPGSFNPLHDGHLAIARKAIYGKMFWEISINRRDKETLSLEELETRIKAIHVKKYDVILTNAVYFRDKVGAIKTDLMVLPIFHVGYDTAERLINDDGTMGVAGINARFHVYGRAGKGFDDIERAPYNMHPGALLSQDVINLSSTKIREEANGRTIQTTS